MGKKLKHFIVLFGPYLYFLGVLLMILSGDFNLVFLPLLLIGIVSSFFGRIYCIYLIIKTRKGTHDKWILHLILIIVFGSFYVPIYYVHCVLKKKIIWGLLLAFVYPIAVIALVVFILLLRVSTLPEYNYHVTSDGKVSVSLPSRYKCKTEDIGEAELKCETTNKEELFKIYNFDSNTDKAVLFNEYYEELYEIYSNNKRITIENEIKKDYYILFDVDEAGEKLQVIIDLKDIDEDNYSVIIYVATKEHSVEYSKIYSSVKARFLEDFA